MTTDIQSFDFSVDLMRALLWQYNEATVLQTLLQEKSDWYEANQQEFWQNWVTNVFDLRTANQFGLAVWGIILGLQLYVNTPPNNDRPLFGFGGLNGTVNFNNGNFANDTGISYLLPIETQRIALQLRYLQLTSSGTVPEINRALKWIFRNKGRAYLIDYHNMTQEYVFLFPLTSDLVHLFDNYDILPRPAGVSSRYIDATKTYFGFRTTDYNFNNGNFGS